MSKVIEFKDKVVVVTGAGGVLCGYMAKEFAKAGAKAAISNFTQWLAVHFSKVGIRCNAIAPGFLVTNQNRGLLFNKDGSPSERAEKILNQTPMNRFGEAEELIGGLFFLADEKSASFVNGVVLPIDGGFSAYSGV